MSDLQAGARTERALGAAAPSATARRPREQGKLPVRERVALLLDEGSFAEEALLANWEEDGLGADGVVTGVGTVDGRTAVALMANDPTVKAGSWGPKTVEKILRIQERALGAEHADGLPRGLGRRADHRAGADVPRPARRGADLPQPGEAVGVVPQVCVLFGPSAAGGAYIPAFCDVVIMREGNASMYLGSPRMAEMVIGEKVTLEEMGGARMHTGVSGCGHQLVKSDEEGIAAARRYLSYLPTNWEAHPPPAAPDPPARRGAGGADRRADPGGREQAVRHEGADRGARRRGLAAGDPPALGEGAGRRLRAPGRAGDRDRRQPAQAQGRRAVRRLGRQGRALHLDVQRVQRAAAVPRRRAGLHDRHAGRARGDHPARREDDQRRQRGDRAEDLGDRAQGLRRGAVRDGGPGVRARLLPGAAERLDRRDGPAGGDQRRLLQPAAGDRGRDERARPRPRSCARSTPRTSTSCTSPPSW